MNLSLYTILLFTGGMFLLSMTPGPGVSVIVARALGSGFGAGMAAITGLIIGDVIFLCVAYVGLTAIATTYATAFTIVKFVGAAYLIWLGIQSFLGEAKAVKENDTSAGRFRWGSDLAVGLLVTLGNPKPILFYGALMPTFINTEKFSRIDLAIFALIIAAVSYLVLGTYAWLAVRAGNFFVSRSAMVRFKQFTGTILIVAGILVAFL